jgi:hypothetical protein
MKNEFLEMANLKIVTQGLLNFYDWCRSSLDQPCEDPVVGLAISINEGILSDWYEKTVGSLWSKERDEQWEDWKRAEAGLLEKHADRDNAGKIKMRKDGSVSVEENAVEFSKELEELKTGEFKPFFDRMAEGEKKNREILNSPVVARVCCLRDVNRQVKGVSPRILSILLGSVVNQIVFGEKSKQE